MSKTENKPVKTPFNIKTFIISTIGHFVMFSIVIGMAYLYDPTMLVYDFLFLASGVAAIMMGLYHANFERKED